MSGLSSATLTRICRDHLGVSPAAYLKMCQITRAKELLAESESNLNAVAYRCGFATRATFFRAFKRQTGLTPRAYCARTTEARSSCQRS